MSGSTAIAVYMSDKKCNIFDFWERPQEYLNEDNLSDMEYIGAFPGSLVMTPSHQTNPLQKC